MVFQNKETGAMLVYQDNPVGIELELFSYVKPFFCLNKLAYIAVCAGHVREYPLLSLVRTPQERRQFYLSPLEKRFYSTLYSPNMNDVTFPLISPEIYSRYFHHSEFDILDNKSPSENSSPSIDPSENPPGRKSLNDPSIGGGEGGCIMEWP